MRRQARIGQGARTSQAPLSVGLCRTLSSRQSPSSADQPHTWQYNLIAIEVANNSWAQNAARAGMFVRCAAEMRSLKVGALLSDYRLRPFSFSRGLHAGILLLAYIYSLAITPSSAGRKRKICPQLVLHQGGKFRDPIIRSWGSVLDLDRYHVTLRPLLNKTCSQQTKSWSMSRELSFVDVKAVTRCADVRGDSAAA
jgi:hypothetical protein